MAHNIYQNSKLLVPVVYFTDPVLDSVMGCLGRATYTVHLISVPDQPAGKQIFHYIGSMSKGCIRDLSRDNCMKEFIKRI